MTNNNDQLFRSQLEINGEKRMVTFRTGDTLLEILRTELGLTGAKPGCLNGDCGACTIIADGIALKSCLILAIEAIDKKITTIEGLKGAPIQISFVENFAFQCGYCTPGFIMNGHSLIKNELNPTDEKIVEYLESNICRCTSYIEIENALKEVLRIKEG